MVFLHFLQMLREKLTILLSIAKYLLEMVLYTSHPSTEEVEAGALPQVLDQAGLHNISSVRVIELETNKQASRQTNEKNTTTFSMVNFYFI